MNIYLQWGIIVAIVAAIALSLRRGRRRSGHHSDSCCGPKHHGDNARRPSSACSTCDADCPLKSR